MRSPRPCSTRSAHSALAFPVCSCADCRYCRIYQCQSLQRHFCEAGRSAADSVSQEVSGEYAGQQTAVAQYRNNRLFVDILSIYNGKEGESWRESALFAPAVEKANRARNASFSAKMRCATPAPRSIPRSVIAAASGYTAKTYDKSITAQFVHNAMDKSITNPIESKCFQWDFRVLRRKLCLKIPSISHAACRAKYQTL